MRPPEIEAYSGTGLVRKSGFGEESGRPVRLMLLFLGWLNVALGVIGAFLPLVPTTIFLLIALWCFTRSSPRVAMWLYSHERLGLALRRWHEERIVPIEAKVAAFVSISASLLFVHGFYPDMIVGKWVATAVCVAVLSFLLSRPHATRSTVTAVAATAVDRPV